MSKKDNYHSVSVRMIKPICKVCKQPFIHPNTGTMIMRKWIKGDNELTSIMEAFYPEGVHKECAE